MRVVYKCPFKGRSRPDNSSTKEPNAFRKNAGRRRFNWQHDPGSRLGARLNQASALQAAREIITSPIFAPWRSLKLNSVVTPCD